MALHTTTAADGTRLAYEDDQSDAPAALLVYGWMTTRAVWDALRPQLAGMRLVMPDLRGSGESEVGKAGLSLDLLAQDIIHIADAAGLERFHLLGHSMGGQLAQLVADRVGARIQTLALVNPVPLAGLPLPPEVADVFRAAGGNPQAFGGILDQACRNLALADRTKLMDAAMGIAPPVIAAVFDAWMQGVPGTGTLRVTAPTVVVATDDPFLPPQLLSDAVVSRIHGARLVTLRGPGHYPQLEAPAELASTLLEHWGR